MLPKSFKIVYSYEIWGLFSNGYYTEKTNGHTNISNSCNDFAVENAENNDNLS